MPTRKQLKQRIIRDGILLALKSLAVEAVIWIVAVICICIYSCGIPITISKIIYTASDGAACLISVASGSIAFAITHSIRTYHNGCDIITFREGCSCCEEYDEYDETDDSISSTCESAGMEKIAEEDVSHQ